MQREDEYAAPVSAIEMSLSIAGDLVGGYYWAAATFEQSKPAVMTF